MACATTMVHNFSLRQAGLAEVDIRNQQTRLMLIAAQEEPYRHLMRHTDFEAPDAIAPPPLG
jgi:ribosomal protein L25 (general stress protein Ctc)